LITIRETTRDDLAWVQALWADGDVMRFVGFPDGMHQSDEYMDKWFHWICSGRPDINHYCIFDGSTYCGEAFYSIDRQHGNSASLDIKLFGFARGKGIATRGLSHAMEQAFEQGADTVWVDPVPQNNKAIALYQRLGFVPRPMPRHLIDEEGVTSIYMERARGQCR
jgi:RimJ/RimL family protein N-acetyltransferase